MVSGSDQTKGIDDRDMQSRASDRTVSGTFGASTRATSSSEVNDFINSDGIPSLGVLVGLTAVYTPSFQPGGDNPGGWAEAELESVIEFVMPEGEVVGEYFIVFRNEHPTIFNGSTHLLLENLTQSTVIFELSEPQISSGDIDLDANAGDLIRVTTVSEGSGSTGPGSDRRYSMDVDLRFAVPEPGTLVMLGLGMLVLVHTPTRKARPQSVRRGPTPGVP